MADGAAAMRRQPCPTTGRAPPADRTVRTAHAAHAAHAARGLRNLLASLYLGGLLVACSPTPEPGFHSRPVPHDSASGPSFGRDFQLTDASGQTRRLEDFRAQVVLLFFGYTHCPDYCPTTLSNLAQMMRELGADQARVQVIFISLDPERDTPERVDAYVRQFHPAFLALSGDAAAIRAVAQEFQILYLRQPAGDGQYRIDHSSYTYIYDPRGRLRLYAQQGEPADHLAADVKRLLATSAP